MRILHLTLSFSAGGRREAIKTLLTGLPALGAECELVCLEDFGASEKRHSRDRELEVISRRSAFDLGAVWRLRRIVRERAFDIVHTHDGASHHFAALARLGRRMPRVLMTFHRSLGFESATFRDRLRNALAIRHSGAIVTCSRERRDHFLRENFVSPEKVVRIPLGIDLTRFTPDAKERESVRLELGLEPGVTVFGAVGHFGPEKGLDVVLRGFSEIAHRHDPRYIALLIVGDGTAEQRKALRELACAADPARVIFVGYHQSIERWYRAADVLLHAPRLEGFGLVVIEAMACSLPVIATRVGGLTDIVREDQTGFLTAADSPSGLANAAGRLLHAPELARSMGDLARQVALEEYGADLYTRRYFHLYSDLLSGRKRWWGDEPPAVGGDEQFYPTSSSPRAGVLPHDSSLSSPTGTAQCPKA